jgi:thiol-disulfide isomerase/thioredoxin
LANVIKQKEPRMARIYWALPAVLAVALAAPLQGADETPTDTWKTTLYLEGQPQPFWILKLQNKEGKWTGDIAVTNERVPKTTLSDFKVIDGIMSFTVKFGEVTLQFQGKAPAAGARKFSGSFKQGATLVPADLELTTLTSLSEFDLAKEALAKPTTIGIDTIDLSMSLLRQAHDKKATPEEVRSWAAKAADAAKPYGPRWEREVTLRLADTLLEQEEFAATALDYARKAERFLDPKEDRPSAQKRTLDLLANALKKAKKDDEAKEVEARIKKIPTEIKPTAFAGRKEKSDRVVLVELFTGSECPPCVAADAAFDALAKSYKPSEVVLLQYHLHVPRPDPLTGPDSLKRAEYYGGAIRGTPTIILNGKVGPGIGGDLFDSIESYDDCRNAIDPALEKTSKAILKASATQKDNKITISAEATGIETPGDKIRLRLALVEDKVAYKGGNGVTEYHSVVRALPGGAAGLALKEKSGKHEANVDLDELRKSLTKYLDDYAGTVDAFPNKERPLELKNFRVVAFVQNDQTKEVLQAIQVPVVGNQ